eukprot:1158251-Pelagomonas_calceolata.AAC.1
MQPVATQPQWTTLQLDPAAAAAAVLIGAGQCSKSQLYLCHQQPACGCPALAWAASTSSCHHCSLKSKTPAATSPGVAGPHQTTLLQRCQVAGAAAAAACEMQRQWRPGHECY